MSARTYILPKCCFSSRSAFQVSSVSVADFFQVHEIASEQEKRSEGDIISRAISETYEDQPIGTCKPSKLFNAICSIEDCTHYANKEQQDACELLRKLIEHWTSTNKDLSNLFTGSFVSTVKCMSCMAESNS